MKTNTDLMNLLFDNIKKYRKEFDLSQSKLERLSGLGNGCIARLENHHRIDPKFSTIYRICAILGIKIDDIVREHQPIGEIRYIDNHLINRISRLSKNKKILLCDFLVGLENT